MPLMDFLSMAGAANGTDMPSWMPATLFGSKFSVSYGQNLSGFLLCGRQTHILGQELKMVTDPTSWLTAKSVLGAGIWSLISGAMGKTELYYGRNSGATYVGPKFDINRSADWALAVVKTASLAPTTGAVKLKPDNTVEKPAGAFGQNEVDKAAVVAATAMGLIINGVTFGLDIAARVQYTAGTDKDGKAAPTDLFYVLNTLSLSLTSRLIALQETIEVAAAWTNIGQGMLAVAKFLGNLLTSIGLVCLLLLPVAITGGAALFLLAAEEVRDGIAGAFRAIWALEG